MKKIKLKILNKITLKNNNIYKKNKQNNNIEINKNNNINKMIKRKNK